jgi:hypothetical protein
VGSSIATLIGALPIREQPSSPPQSAIPLEAAVLGTFLLGALAIAVALLWARLHRRRDRMTLDENRVRAAMEELCREGWTAQLTLYGSRTPLPGDAPEIKGLRVRIDWAELTRAGGGSREVAVARRLWARSIAGGLRAMVEDRRIDQQLEQIERAVGEEGPGAP